MLLLYVRILYVAISMTSVSDTTVAATIFVIIVIHEQFMGDSVRRIVGWLILRRTYPGSRYCDSYCRATWALMSCQTNCNPQAPNYNSPSFGGGRGARARNIVLLHNTLYTLDYCCVAYLCGYHTCIYIGTVPVYWQYAQYPVYCYDKTFGTYKNTPGNPPGPKSFPRDFDVMH